MHITEPGGFVFEKIFVYFQNMLIPTGERINHEIATKGTLKLETVKKEAPVKPMFNQKDLVKTLDNMVGEEFYCLFVNSSIFAIYVYI